MFKIYGIAVLSAMLVLSMTGCGQMKTKSVKPYEHNVGSADDHMLKESAGASTEKAASDKIAKHVYKVKGVSKATVIVHNRDAIVGIDVKQGENAKDVENKVRETVARSEPGYTVHVTSDQRYHARIQTLQSQMKPLDGHPVRNFSEDVATLLRDIGRTVSAPFR
ncbi:YhcN/YlaJ family sporulation lipoprotein [Cohnella rhizosphaerae]|uniref:YhcN/YlaJ family sporulation lipoprotein n=1 Tax=Cohnella rhizosphaerae TaxID=1457232 RepID=A0A9X4QSE1_9BACL|nr:YhcN/YlaJ family sporulation lipoprotein [Cohnella rhizosphaerae]MDG0808437.1 YhcN/YlaJ family sporulation lipoprotein [Cohnella rhizosphaerae]